MKIRDCLTPIYRVNIELMSRCFDRHTYITIDDSGECRLVNQPEGLTAEISLEDAVTLALKLKLKLHPHSTCSEAWILTQSSVTPQSIDAM